MGIASSGISAPLSQLQPLARSPEGVVAVTPEEVSFLLSLSHSFQAILYEVDGIKTVWSGTDLDAGRLALSLENAALGQAQASEVSGILGVVARSLSINWDALAEEFKALREIMVTTPENHDPSYVTLLAAGNPVSIPPSGRIFVTTTVTANTTLNRTHEVVLCNATSGAITITLPPAATDTRGYFIKKIDSSANAVTIDGDGAETIEGETTLVVSLQYDCPQLVSDGTEWWVI